MRPSPRSCARATLAAFFVWWELLGAQPLMPDFLGGGALEDQGGEVQDYLGRVTERAFKSPPALPAGGGPAPGVAAAPATVGGAGTAAPSVSTSGGGGGGGAAGPTTLAQIARALGISVEALKTSDWARKLFSGDRQAAGVPTPTSFPQMQSGQGAELENAMDDATFAALVREAMSEQGGGISGLSAGNVAGAAGLGGSALGLTGSLLGNKDVSRAGQAAGIAGSIAGGVEMGTAAGTSGAAAGAGAGAGITGAVGGGVIAGLQQAYDIANRFNQGDKTGAELELALFPLGLGSAAGFGLDLSRDNEARIASDVASAKNVLGAKVPAAISRLGKTLTDMGSLDPASATTEQLLAAQQSLQAARTEFNAVDQAFKGGITIAGKPINTGLSLDMVKPQLDALNESQLRIQDALESRGIQSGQIPGYQSPLDWLNFLDSPLYQQYTTGTPRFSEGVEFEPADLQNPEITAALKGMQPGQTEAGLRALIARGLPARVPRPSPESLVGQAFGGEDFAPVASAMDAP